MAANLLVLAVLSSVFPTHRIACQVAVAGALYHSDNSPERVLLLSHVLQHYCLGRQVVMLDLQLWWMHYKQVVWSCSLTLWRWSIGIESIMHMHLSIQRNTGL